MILKKAFDSVSHACLLQKLQSLGIAGDLWLSIMDYLNDRKMVSIVQGAKSSFRDVRYGVPQGSVLGLILFSLFCNDLLDIIQDEKVDIEMFADDTTINAMGQNPDIVANTLNNILKKLSIWCLKNSLTPHLGKTEYVLLGCPKFKGPFQKIRFGNATIKRVYSKSCLGLKIDSGLKWNIHTQDLVKSLTQKLNVLKSFYFLPLQARLEFYYRVIIPSITYGILIWGSVGKSIFDKLERIHTRAA